MASPIITRQINVPTPQSAACPPINAIRAHLSEFGIVAPVGRNGVEELLGVVVDPNDKRLPEVARACLTALGAQLRMLEAQAWAGTD
jgi:hypothetical protein